MPLAAGDYIARVEIIEGTFVLADRLCLLASTPTAGAHWSVIKAMYR